MRILVACEFSGAIRDRLIARGHDAWSCDLLDCETRQGNHLKGDVRYALEGALHKFPDARDIRTGNAPLFRSWDMLIAHPPCTFLANSGVRWLFGGKGKRRDAQRWRDMEAGAAFFKMMLGAPIAQIAIENPVMHGYARELIGRGHDQLIQPWNFGTPETKATCFWLKGLKPLIPAYETWVQCRNALGLPVDAMPRARVHRMGPGADRQKERSRTYAGIAAAIAAQWG